MVIDIIISSSIIGVDATEMCSLLEVCDEKI